MEHLFDVISYEQSRLMPAASGEACIACGYGHLPHEPHNAASPQYQEWFANRLRQLGLRPRPATWKEAAEHCDQQTRAEWQELLAACGIEVSLTG
jgi:hypothetical protein